MQAIAAAANAIGYVDSVQNFKCWQVRIVLNQSLIRRQNRLLVYGRLGYIILGHRQRPVFAYYSIRQAKVQCICLKPAPHIVKHIGFSLLMAMVVDR